VQRFCTCMLAIRGTDAQRQIPHRILQENHDARIAVIENEFGQVGVDAEFLSRSDQQTIIQLANGCLCCADPGDLARALHDDNRLFLGHPADRPRDLCVARLFPGAWHARPPE
jgi:CobW/HypB/UreG, nucleotide-binding domain